MDKMYDINFKGVFLIIKEALPFMQDRKGANIVILSSYAAYEPLTSIGFYSITKTMLVVMGKLIATELGSAGIR